MQYTDSCLKPLGTRTSATDPTATLKPWDVATVADLKAIPSINPRDVGGTRTTDYMTLPRGREERVLSLNGGRMFRWHPTSELDGDDQLVIIPDDRNSDVDTALAADLAGRWLAVPGQVVDLALPFTHSTADAAILYTMPTGARLALQSLYWEITTACTGGSSAAIGVSSSTHTAPTNLSTKGDLLGGSGGDVTATLGTAGIIAGTIGTDMDTLTKLRGALFVAADTFRYDRIVDVYAAGAGNVHVYGMLLANAGA